MPKPHKAETVAVEETEGALSIDQLLGYNMKRVYMLVHASLQQALTEDGITARTFSALGIIVESPGISQSDLSRRLGIERSGIVAIIDDLEGRGFVRREALRGDRRVQALQPTESGRVSFRIMFEKVRTEEDACLERLTPQERSELQNLLRKIRKSETAGQQ